MRSFTTAPVSGERSSSVSRSSIDLASGYEFLGCEVPAPLQERADRALAVLGEEEHDLVAYAPSFRPLTREEKKRAAFAAKLLTKYGLANVNV